MTHSPFVKLTNIYIERGALFSKPLLIKPEDIKEILDGKVFIANGNYDVKEIASEIEALVIEKTRENKEIEALGK